MLIGCFDKTTLYIIVSKLILERRKESAFPGYQRFFSLSKKEIQTNTNQASKQASKQTNKQTNMHIKMQNKQFWFKLIGFVALSFEL